MKQTLKITVVAVAVSGLVIGLAPFVVGKFAYAAIDDFMADINQRGEQTARWFSYDAGWFSSTAVVQVNAAALAGSTNVEGEPVWLPMRLKLNHGPMFLDTGVRFGWLKGFAAFDLAHEAAPEDKVDVQGSSKFLTTGFMMDLAGTVAFQQQSDAFVMRLGNSVYAVEGVSVRGTYSPFGSLTVSAAIASVNLSRGDGETHITDVHASLDADLQQRHHPFAIPGGLTLSVERLSLVNAGDVFFQVDDLHLLSALAVDADAQLGNLHIKTSSARTQLLGEVIEGAATDIELQRMSLEFFNNLVVLLQNSPPRQGGEAQSALQVLPLMSYQLLPPGPQLRLKRLHFTVPEGDFSAQGAARVKEQPNSPVDLLAALHSTHAELELKLGQSLALRILKMQAAIALDEKMFASGQILSDLERKEAIATVANERLEQLLQQGYLASRDGELTAKLELHNGVITANRQQLPLPF